MTKEIDKKHITGGETDGGITSSYATDDGVKLKVPYSFMGTIYDEAEEQAVLAAMKQDTLTMGPKTAEFQEKFAKNVRSQTRFRGFQLHHWNACGDTAF